MSVEKVKAYFAGFGMEGRVLEFPVSSATVAEAATALHCEPCHIAKTLAFLVCETPMVIVMAGDARIDNAKYKARFAKKAKMPTPDEVLTLIGHPVGGVCPFAVPKNVNVYLDVSLRRFETVYPACGSPNSAIEIIPAPISRMGSPRRKKGRRVYFNRSAKTICSRTASR